MYIQYNTSTTGGTITLKDTGSNITLCHEALLAATMTIELPSTPQDGQIVTLSSSGGITALTLTAIVGTILNLITELLAGSPSAYMYSKAQDKWFKVV